MSTSSGAVIDDEGFELLLEMVGPDMPELVIDILDTYFGESDDQLQIIESAAESGDLQEMLRPVHSLKSSSASMGAMRLAALCADLEQFLRGFGPELDVDDYVERILEEYALAVAELQVRRDKYEAM